MAQSINQIKNRIRSIENTEKVTSAMQMVSSSKLNRMDNILLLVKPYFEKTESLLSSLLGSAAGVDSPLIGERQVKKNVLLCVMASDAGLCGVYNNNVLKVAEEFIAAQKDKKIKLLIIGKKGFSRFKNQPGTEITNFYIGLNGKYSERVAREIINFITGSYVSGMVDEVYVVYTHFQTALVHKPVVEKLLDLVVKPGKPRDYICDPGRQEILQVLIPRFVGMRFRLMLLEAFTSEHAARTISMKMATENAHDMLQSLTLLRNKVRQAKITEEMLEIISSAEALKG
jgi:F-type H+-transporting ATPase subunit gamma